MSAELSVLHVAQPVDGGVGRYVAELVEDQLRRGWDVAVACPRGHFLAEQSKGAGATHVEWRASRKPGPGTASETLGLGRTASSIGPSLVHLHSSKAGLAGRAAIRGRVCTVFQPHAWSFLAVAGLPRRAAASWERFAARWADAVVCVSDGERELGEQAGIQAAWRVIPNGVDVSAIGEASPQDRQAARRELDLPPVPIVVCAGRVCEQKGQDVLIDSWPLVLAKIPEARLMFVGGGPDLEELRGRAGAGVVFAGHSDDVLPWLDAADVIVIPSRWEGMSLVMLDAIARGRSVVSTDVPGASEALGALEGAVVPTMDGPALARALALRLESPERVAAEGRANRLTAERSFDVRRTLAQTADLYTEVIARRTSSRP